MRRNIRTRAHLDQNLLPTYLSSEYAVLPQVFDTLCIYRFASTLQMLNEMKFWSIVNLSYKHQLDESGIRPCGGGALWEFLGGDVPLGA